MESHKGEGRELNNSSNAYVKYHNAATWYEKVILMHVYHEFHNNTIIKTAKFFGTSIGLASENLTLANNLDKVMNCNSRAEALRKLKESKINE